MKRLLAVEEILKKTRVIQEHKDFELQAAFRWQRSGVVVDPQGLLGYSLTLTVFTPSLPESGGVSDGSVDFTFNPTPDRFSSRIYSQSEKEWDVACERQLAEPLRGFRTFVPEEDGGLRQVLITAGGRTPWRQVTREEFLQRELKRLEEDDAGQTAAYRAALAATPYQEWLAGAAQRKRDREAVIAAVAGPDAAQAAMLRLELEKNERELTDQFKASEERDRRQNDLERAAPSVINLKRAALAALKPEERTALAWMSPADPTRFVAPDAPNARRLILPDATFFKKGPDLASDARAMAVTFVGGGDGRAIVQAIMDELDWAALGALLEAPPK